MKELFLQEIKQWQFKGFSEDESEPIDNLLMQDTISYWFHFRSIPWFRIRRFRLENPEDTIKKVLSSLNLKANIIKVKERYQLFTSWIIQYDGPKDA